MNYYEMLGVAPNVDAETLQKAITQQSAQWSKRASNAATTESRHQAERKLQAIQDARQVLLKVERRAEYDQSLPSLAPAPPQVEDRIPCPYCLESILRHAKKCRWCNEWLDGTGNKAQVPPSEPTVVVDVVDAQIVEVSASDMTVVPVNVASDDVMAAPDTWTPTITTAPRRSRTVAFLLGLLFGPLGLFYAGAGHGWAAIFLWGVLAAVSGGALGVVVWLLCPFWAVNATGTRNKQFGHLH
jgi:hypothetical protein